MIGGRSAGVVFLPGHCGGKSYGTWSFWQFRAKEQLFGPLTFFLYNGDLYPDPGFP
jgi:hypothetical protein